jgi:tetratricopeptide (TPR) repeat protein
VPAPPPTSRIPNLADADVFSPPWRVEWLETELEGVNDSTPPAKTAALLHELGLALANVGGRDTDALKAHLRAYSELPSFGPALLELVNAFERRRNLKHLSRLYEAERKLDKGAAAGSLLDLANLAEDQGQPPDEVQAMLADALAQNPDNALIALTLERVARANRATDDTLRALRARVATTEDPALQAALSLDLAVMLEADGQIDAALEALSGAEQAGTARFRLLQMMERIASRHDRPAWVVRALEGQAQLAAAAGAGADGDEAGDTAVQSVARFEDQVRANEEAAALALEAARVRTTQLDDSAGALASIGHAMRLAPDDMLLRYEHLLGSERTGDLEGAAEDARQLLSRGVTGPLAGSLWFRVAEAARSRNDDEGQRSALEQALAADPSAVVARLALRDLLARTMDTSAHIALMEARASAVTGDARSQWLSWAAQLAVSELDDHARGEKLFRDAIMSATDPTDTLREAYEAAIRAGNPAAASNVGAALVDRDISPRERARLMRERFELLLGPLDDEAGAHALLITALEDPDSEGWVRDAARMEGALARNYPLLALAHDALATGASAEVAAAHHVAAARARLRAKDVDGAERSLRAALAESPGSRYAVTLLEEILRARGDADEVVQLLRNAADAQRGAEAEVNLLLAGAAAEAGQDFPLAADTYREALAQNPDAIASIWALERLARRTKNAALLSEALTARADRERAAPSGSASMRGALLLGEHAGHLTDRPADAVGHLQSALGADDASTRAAAATALLHLPLRALGDDALANAELLSASVAAWVERLPSEDPARRELEAAFAPKREPGSSGKGAPEEGAGAGSSLMGDGDELADAEVATVAATNRGGTSATTTTSAVHGVIASFRSDGLSGGGQADVVRARAYRDLASVARDEGARRELLLHAVRARSLAGDEDAATDAFVWAQDLIGAFRSSQEAAVAIDETSDAGDDPAGRALALAGRAAISSRRVRHTVVTARARAELAAGNYEVAARELRAVLEEDPEDLTAWESLRVAAREVGDFEAVAEACDKLARRVDGALRAQLLEEAAVCLMDHVGDDAGAEERLRQALDLDPTRTIPFWRLHDLLAERKADEVLLALVDARLGANDDPDELPKLYYEQARLRRGRGGREDVLESLENLLMLEDDHPGGLALAVEVHVTLENWAAAVNALRQLAEADVPPAQRRIARLGAADFLEKKLGRPREAIAELRALEPLGFGNAELYERIADTAMRGGEHAEAIRALQQVHDSSPRDAATAAMRRAGEVARDHLRDRSTAIECFRTALRTTPTDIPALEALSGLVQDATQRRVLSESFEAAARAEHRERFSAALPRQLGAAARLRHEKDLEFCATQTLLALGVATPEERQAADEHTAMVRRVRAAAPLSPSSLDLFRAPGDGGVTAAFAQLVGETLTLASGVEPSFFNVGRGELSSTKPSALREELTAISEALAAPLGDIYVGGSDAARVTCFHGKKERATWVIGAGVIAPLDTARRYHAGRAAFATYAGSIAWLDRPAEEGALLLLAAAAAAEVVLPAASAAPGLTEWARAIGKALPRKLRKPVADLAVQLPAGGAQLVAYCRAAKQSAARAGLTVSGDLHGTLSHLHGREPRVAEIQSSPYLEDLVLFWTSRDALTLRRELGLAT